MAAKKQVRARCLKCIDSAFFTFAVEALGVLAKRARPAGPGRGCECSHSRRHAEYFWDWGSTRLAKAPGDYKIDRYVGA